MPSDAVEIAMETEPHYPVVPGAEAAIRSIVTENGTQSIDRGLPQDGPIAAGADPEAQLEFGWAVVLGLRGQLRGDLLFPSAPLSRFRGLHRGVVPIPQLLSGGGPGGIGRDG